CASSRIRFSSRHRISRKSTTRANVGAAMALVYAGDGVRPCTVDPPLVLAPMAGITDMTYRLLLRGIGGVGLVTMEFVSSEGLTRGNWRTERLLRFDPEERPLSIQIYGADAERMAIAAAQVE